MSVATFTCKGQSKEGERRYQVKLLKDAQFSKLDLNDPGAVRRPPGREVWRQGWVRGHFPGRRGIWDLVGGALNMMLGSRLVSYRRDDTLPREANITP